MFFRFSRMWNVASTRRETEERLQRSHFETFTHCDDDSLSCNWRLFLFSTVFFSRAATTIRRSKKHLVAIKITENVSKTKRDVYIDWRLAFLCFAFQREISRLSTEFLLVSANFIFLRYYFCLTGASKKCSENIIERSVQIHLPTQIFFVSSFSCFRKFHWNFASMQKNWNKQTSRTSVTHAGGWKRMWEFANIANSRMENPKEGKQRSAHLHNIYGSCSEWAQLKLDHRHIVVSSHQMRNGRSLWRDTRRGMHR